MQQQNRIGCKPSWEIFKGKSRNSSVSNTLDPLSQKLENENVELEFQVRNYEKEIAHLKTTYKNLFDSISVTRAQTKTIIDSLQHKLHDTIYENAKLRAQLFDKVSDQVDTTKGTSTNTKFANHKVNVTNDLSKPVTSNSVPTPQESKIVKHDNVIAPGMFRINPFKPSREEKSSCNKNKEVEVEEHHRNLLLSKNKKHMSSECKHVKLDTRNDQSEVICAMCKQCLITANHDVCMLNYVNDMNSRGKKQKANVSNTENQKKQKPKVKKPKKVGSNERLASPKPSKPRFCLRWSPTGRFFDIKGKIIASSESESQSDCSNGDNACTSNPSEPKIKRFPNSTFFLGRLSKFFLGTVRFGNDHVAAILGFGDLQWGNILITRVYFVEGLGHNLFSVGQFCDSDLEVAFRRNSCFVRSLEGVDLLKGNRSTNLYTINLHEMASASPICLMARATSTKSWLWHQRLSHLNFNTINDLAKNDLVTGLPKFKYHKEHIRPSCEQGKSKRASHPPKPVPNSKQRLHLLIWICVVNEELLALNGKRYVFGVCGRLLCYTWVYNRRTKKIMETMNVTFDELSAMAFEQISSKPGLQSMTFGQISLGLDLTYASSTITTQQPTENEAYSGYFLAYATHNRSLCVKWDVKLFLCMVTLKEDVWVKQAPQGNGTDELSKSSPTEYFYKGKIDPSLFIDASTMTSTGTGYVDDIIFGSTNPRLPIPPWHLYKPVQLVLDNPLKIWMELVIPFVWYSQGDIKDKLDLDQNGSLVDATKYRSMIGALMYLTSSRPDIVHATYADYAGCKDTFKSTSGGAQFLGKGGMSGIGFLIVQNAVQNPSVQNVGNQNGLIIVLGIANQNPNGNGNVVAARAEGNAIRNNGNQIMCYNCKDWVILAWKLQPVRDQGGGMLLGIRNS
ncbi:retrovirus-related pol polyprotein from transposon TNT 1-94 [Tanacetum coccineum]